MKYQRYFDAVAYLESLSAAKTGADFMLHRGGDPSIFLRRTKSFLKLLGNPERGFKVVHITGTAGKGTTATMVHNMLVAAGHRTGLFTSPFVTTSAEKITVNGTIIGPEQFADLVERIKPAVDRAFASGAYGIPSYFELFFALAMLYFKQQRCQWVVLEAGLGGMYDATNVIPAPRVAAITNINFDHMHILGPTLGHIARDKAGIIKRGSVFYTSEQRPAMLKIFRSRAAAVGARWGVIANTHADPNTRLALAIGRELGLPSRAIARGIRQTRLPARFEVVQRKPTVIIDGAHNPAKLGNTVHKLQRLKAKKIIAVVALAANKDARTTLRELAAVVDKIFVTRFFVLQRKAASPLTLQRTIHKLRPRLATTMYLDPHQALDQALSAAGPKDIVVVTGSFFLAGELRKRWYPEERILARRSNF